MHRPSLVSAADHAYIRIATGVRKASKGRALDALPAGPMVPAKLQQSTTERFPVAEKVLAAVRTGPGRTEIREYPMPDVPDDAALLKMEVAGICGTDVRLYREPPTDKPTIMGHENIGYIAKAGREFTRRKGFKEGDLVFVEHYVMCGKCEWCHLGEYRHCENTNWRTNPDAIRYGYTSDEKPPHLWGGFAQYIYLPWNAVRAPRAQGRDAGACGTRHPDGQRGRVVAVRRRGRLQLDGADPGARPAGTLADCDLQTGWRLADHRHWDCQGRRAAEGRQRTRRRLRHRRDQGRPPRPHHGDHRRQGRRRLARLHCRRRHHPDPARHRGAQAQGRHHRRAGRDGGVPELPAGEIHCEVHHYEIGARAQLSAPASSRWSRSRQSASHWRRSRRIVSASRTSILPSVRSAASPAANRT